MTVALLYYYNINLDNIIQEHNVQKKFRDHHNKKSQNQAIC